MDKYYMLLVSISVFGQCANGRSWGGYDDYPSRDYHHTFNYNNWCHSASGWDWKNSWEDNDSNESYGWGDERLLTTKSQQLRTTSSSSTTTSRNIAMTISNSGGKTTTQIKASSTGSTPSPIEVLLCLRLCPLTSEYNPICGSDNNTYRNPGRLECARTCGIDVSVQRLTACEVNPTAQPTTTTTTTSRPQPTTAPVTTSTATTPTQLFFMACTRSCPVTSEYNPVCGSDNITYDNLSRFHCAKNCGKTNLSIARTSRCPAMTEPGMPVLTSTPATNAISSITRQSTQATSTTTTSSTSSARPTAIVVNPTENTQAPNALTSDLGFTIPQNILESIFLTTHPDYNVDERVGS